MFDNEINELLTQTIIADRTFNNKRALNRFLKTLTPAQIIETQIMVDDEMFVVFFPVSATSSERHFDTGEVAGAASAKTPVVRARVEVTI
jgi:hypothetical protein